MNKKEILKVLQFKKDDLCKISKLPEWRGNHQKQLYLEAQSHAYDDMINLFKDKLIKAQKVFTVTTRYKNDETLNSIWYTEEEAESFIDKVSKNNDLEHIIEAHYIQESPTKKMYY